MELQAFIANENDRSFFKKWKTSLNEVYSKGNGDVGDGRKGHNPTWKIIDYFVHFWFRGSIDVVKFVIQIGIKNICTGGKEGSGYEEAIISAVKSLSHFCKKKTHHLNIHAKRLK